MVKLRPRAVDEIAIKSSPKSVKLGYLAKRVAISRAMPPVPSTSRVVDRYYSLKKRVMEIVPEIVYHYFRERKIDSFLERL